MLWATAKASRSPGRLVDLATGHGEFALQAVALGWEVTAVDARTERWPEDLDGKVKWVQSDIREVDLEPYDLILCLGLFYHLTVEDQVALLTRAATAGKPVLIDTHLDEGTHEHELSERLTVMERYVGRLYREAEGPKASWGNDLSFWPTLDSFHRMCRDCGYPVVFTLEPWWMPDRTMFLALPDDGLKSVTSAGTAPTAPAQLDEPAS